jgi:sugar fermentation stimulation protein A
MKFTGELTEAVLLKRYDRILVDVAVSKKEIRTIYCPNNGLLRGCDSLGSRVWFSTSLNPKRKHPYVWEIVEVDGGHLVLVNNLRSHDLIIEAFEGNQLPELAGYDGITKDVLLDKPNTVVDLSLKNFNSNQGCYVMVEQVTMGDEIHRGFFPDAPHTRSLKELNDLIDLKIKGHRAVLFFLIQHTGIDRVFPADHVDKQYGLLLREAIKVGVEICAYKLAISFTEIKVDSPIEVIIPKKLPLISKPI